MTDETMTFTAYAMRSGCSQPHISKLVADGVIHGPALVGEGRARRIIPAIADQQRADTSVRPLPSAASATTGTLNAERLRLTTAQANRAEMENLVRRGELIPRTALAAAIPPLARSYADQIHQLLRDIILDDVQHARLATAIHAATEQFIEQALTHGGPAPAPA